MQRGGRLSRGVSVNFADDKVEEENVDGKYLAIPNGCSMCIYFFTRATSKELVVEVPSKLETSLASQLL